MKKNKIIIINSSLSLSTKKNTDTHLIDKIDSGSATKRGEAISIYHSTLLFIRYLSLLYKWLLHSTSHNHNTYSVSLSEARDEMKEKKSLH